MHLAAVVLLVVTFNPFHKRHTPPVAPPPIPTVLVDPDPSEANDCTKDDYGWWYIGADGSISFSVKYCSDAVTSNHWMHAPVKSWGSQEPALRHKA